MNVAASPIWLAYAFGIGVALALVDRALKVRWLAGLFGTGGVAILAYAAYQSYAHAYDQGLWTALTVFGLVALGYALAEALFLIGWRVRR